MRELLFGGEMRIHTRRLVAECEGFIQGQLALECERSGGVAAGWMWLNALAHGDAALIAACEQGLGFGEGLGADVWGGAIAFLASEVKVIECETGASLGEVQRDVLVPLELRLADDPYSWRIVPSQLVPKVVDALERFRNARLRDRRAALREPA